MTAPGPDYQPQQEQRSRPERTIPELLDVAMDRFPTAVAFRRGNGLDALTFAEWGRLVKHAADKIAREVPPGALVGLVYSPDQWPEFAISYLACQHARAIPVPLPPTITRHELAAVSGADHALAGYLSEVDRPELGLEQLLLGSEEGQAREGGQYGLQGLPDDPAHIILTSGSTGRPKGVVATHRQVLRTTGGPPRTWERKTLLHTMAPWSTAGCEGCLIFHLRAAMTVIVLDLADAWQILDRCEAEEPAILYLSPTMAGAVLDAHRLGSDVGANCVEFVLLGGHAPSATVLRGLHELFERARIVSLYGLTEAGGTQVVMPYDPRRPSAAGKPTARAAVKIVDQAGSDCRPPSIGEIWIRQDPEVMRRYHGDETASAEVFLDNWVRTGDLGHLDEDGYLYVTGRIKDLIIVGGQNVSAEEVEACLLQHAAVLEAAVIGVPDARTGEAIAAFVVLREPVGAAEVRRFTRNMLARHKVPRFVLAVSEIPRSALGKVRKGELRERFLAGDASPLS